MLEPVFKSGFLTRVHSSFSLVLGAEAADAVRALNAKLRLTDKGAYSGSSVGGPTECYWG